MATRAKGVNAAHTAGIFADMTLDGPEIGTLVAVIDRAKNLPNRKTMGKQDPYCAMRLGKEAKKTETDKRGGQTPKWDQELRFTVHESPDYYKLKCSVFNDDKKTDLISETWIDLQDVIVPGGGQSDQWRQLNFKGKYAGDIRVELTYYDTRPKPETPLEARKQRGKAHSLTSDVTSTASGSHQLGPREIKRRPLPSGSGGYCSPASAAPAFEHSPVQQEREPVSSHEYSTSHPPPRPPKQKFIPETPDDVGSDLNPQFGPDSYNPPFGSHLFHHQRQPPDDFQDSYERSFEPDSEVHAYAEAPVEARPLPAQPIQPQFAPASEQQLLQAAPRSPYGTPDRLSYHSSPQSRMTTQEITPAAAQNQPWNGRASTSPTKFAAYRDSPLRQSLSHVDMRQPVPLIPTPDHRFDEDVPPPPPPSHRGQLSRISVDPRYREGSWDPTPAPDLVPTSHWDSYGQPSPRTPVKFQTIEDRSPLQRLERDCDPFQAPPPTQELTRPLPLSKPHAKSPSFDHDRYPVLSTERRKSNNADMSQSRPTSTSSEAALPDQPYDQNSLQNHYQGSPRDDFRSHAGYAPPRRAQTFDAFEPHDERHARMSDPVVGRPRALSPNRNHNIPRKSITPTPGTPDDSRNMGTTPFGPDSYDVLNPGPSPTVDNGAYKSPQEALEAARQKEVDKLRDQGPIIGNDGRVIDPSDHLPADTWAPEPERKQRRPEHVIKIRTREEARLHKSAGSSPASARPHSIAVSPYQPPQHAASSPYNSSPAPNRMPPSPQAESPSSRNRLRKPMPQRPLPPQPYANSSPAVPTLPTVPQPMAQRPLPTQSYANSSPVVPTLPFFEPSPSPTSQRHTIQSSPAAGLPQRPPLSGYQAPAASNYSSRGSSGPPALDYRQEYMQQTPTKSRQDRQPPQDIMNYGGGSPYGSENPLAMELSRIDIGPSRVGRTALRPQRAYGAY